MNGHGSERRDDLLLSRVTHDLRSPLGAILGSIDLIERTDDPMLLARFATTVRAAASRLQMMIDDLVWTADDSRGRANDGPAEIVAINDIIERAAQRAASAQLDDGTPVSVSGADGQQLIAHATPTVHILANLILNAATHSADRMISIEAEASEHTVVIDVYDDGSGPEPESWADVVDPGVRGAGATGSGLGLGLSVAHRAAQRLGGSVEVASNDRGATVRFVLPRRLAPTDGALIAFVDASWPPPRELAAAAPERWGLTWYADDAALAAARRGASNTLVARRLDSESLTLAPVSGPDGGGSEPLTLHIDELSEAVLGDALGNG